MRAEKNPQGYERHQGNVQVLLIGHYPTLCTWSLGCGSLRYSLQPNLSQQVCRQRHKDRHKAPPQDQVTSVSSHHADYALHYDQVVISPSIQSIQ